MTDSKAVLVIGVYLMDNTSPVIICIVNVIPSKNPMFQRFLIIKGVGKFINEFIIIFVIGSFFVKEIFFIL